jgi:hypothetical protein
MSITEQTVESTSDIAIATHVFAGGHANLKRVDGPLGRRVFVFDRPVPASILWAFHTADTRRAIEMYRTLLRAVHGHSYTVHPPDSPGVWW